MKIRPLFSLILLLVLCYYSLGAAAATTQAKLTVVKQGNGQVSSAPAGIECGTNCAADFPLGTSVTLTATADAGNAFSSWLGCNNTATNTCTVALTAATRVVARFKPLFSLTVTKLGTGSGVVTSDSGVIQCGTTCSDQYMQDTYVRLVAAPDSGSKFRGWSGVGAESCGTAASCRVKVSQALTITAQFDIVLQVSKVGEGTVVSESNGIQCGENCTTAYTANTLVKLTATPATNYVFSRWNGCDSVAGLSCSVNMTTSKNISAVFKPVYTLDVSKTGSGSGVIRSNVTGIVCGTSCTADFLQNTKVTLSVEPNDVSLFMGWLGACSGTEACSVTMSEAKQVTAVFGRKDKQGKYWVMGYLPGYTQSLNGDINYMRDIDWKTVTHVIHNSAMPNTDGSLNVDTNGVDVPRRQAAIQAAHAHGVPILFGLSGWDSQYRNVLADAGLRATFLTNVLAILDEGYDGIDVDFEPIVRWGEEENPEYETFINELYAALQTRQSALLQRAPLLTVSAIYREHKLLARLQDKFDQINVMAYDQSGIFQGITWHDSALYGGSYTYPTTGRQVVSVNYYMQTLLKAGIPASKLGLGISLETRLWMAGEGTATGGATLPYQTWTTAPRHFMSDGSVPKESFAILMDKYYSADHYHWDDVAQVPYLSYDSEGSASDLFISYNDERSVEAKLQYMKRQGFGGMMLWQLQYDYRPNQVGEAQRPILTTIRNNLY